MPAPCKAPDNHGPAGRLARLVVAALRTTARWLEPRMIGLGRRAVEAAADLARRGRRHPRGVIAVGTRLVWWGALAVLVIAGRELFEGPAVGQSELRALVFACAGLVASCLVLLVGLERRVRWAAFGLGLGHASLAMLAWAALLH